MLDIKAETIALRDKAWAEVKTSPGFALFAALDAAVSAAGGTSLIRQIEDASVVRTGIARAVDEVTRRVRVRPYGGGEIISERRRVSQGDAAEMVLRERGPTTGVDLLNAIPDKGGTIGGEKPMINLTSTMSKDPRFVSLRSGGSYYWWFADEPLPSGWNTGEGLDFAEEPSPVSVSSSQEGGDGHGPATI